TQPWCGFQYFVFGEFRSYLGCTKFDPKLGDCPLDGDLIQWQVIDKTIEQKLMQLGLREHIHQPAVTHLNINHSKVRENVMINPYFWESQARGNPRLSWGPMGVISGPIRLK